MRYARPAIDGIEQRGDLELHVRAPSFYEHGHHADAAYDNVVLHVVYAADGDTDTRLRSGRRVPVAAFAPWVESRIDEIQRWLDTAHTAVGGFVILDDSSDMAHLGDMLVQTDSNAGLTMRDAQLAIEKLSTPR